MKKYIGRFFCSLLSAALLLTSCLGSDDETEISDTAVVYSFTMGDISMPYTYRTSSGNDTTVTKTIYGSTYKFTIDQLGGAIYNSDSLPAGTDVSRVTATISASGYLAYKTASDSVFTYSSSDSVDYSDPLTLMVTSLDLLHTRSYTVKINVAQNDPDSLYWQSLLRSDFPGDQLGEHKSVSHNGKIVVLGRQSGSSTLCHTATDSSDGMAWSRLAHPAGLADGADLQSLTSFNGALYLLGGGALYRSADDGLSWSTVAANVVPQQLLLADNSAAQPSMWVVGQGKFYTTTDGENYSCEGAVPAGFPTAHLNSVAYPLATNAAIRRYVVVGHSDGCSHATVWSRLSTEAQWTNYSPIAGEDYSCPKLDELTVIHYDGKLYAFGKDGTRNGGYIEEFSALYESCDHGLIWQSTSAKAALPAELRGCTAPYSCTVDEHNRIWITFGYSDNGYPHLYRGSITRCLK